MEELFELQSGVISAAQARRHMSRKAVRHRVSSGRWQRPHRLVFVTHSGPIGSDAARWIAVLATGDRAVLGGVTALQSAGLCGYETAAIHVLLPARHRVAQPPDGVIVHRTGVLARDDVLLNARPPRTKVARSIVDAAQWAPDDYTARAVIAAAFQQRLVSADGIDEVLSRLIRARRRPWIAGERVLRFPAWTVRHDKVVVASQLRAALFAAGWRPSR